MTFAVRSDDAGEVLAAGEDLDALRAAVAPAAARRADGRDGPRRALGPARLDDRRAAAHDRAAGPGQRARLSRRSSTRARRPACGCSRRPGAQAAAMHAGTRRLLRADRAVAGARRAARPRPRRGAGARGRAARRRAARCSTTPLLAALDELIARRGGPAWDAAGWAALRAHVAAGSLAEATAADRRAGRRDPRCGARRAPRARRPAARRRAAPARLDVAAQVGGLVYPGFLAATGAARLPDVDALPAAARCGAWSGCPTRPAADRDRMRVVHELEAELQRRATPPAPAPPALREVGWMLQELRVSNFAQGLGMRGAGVGEADPPRAGGAGRLGKRHAAVRCRRSTSRGGVANVIWHQPRSSPSPGHAGGAGGNE